MEAAHLRLDRDHGVAESQQRRRHPIALGAQRVHGAFLVRKSVQGAGVSVVLDSDHPHVFPITWDRSLGTNRDHHTLRRRTPEFPVRFCDRCVGYSCAGSSLEKFRGSADTVARMPVLLVCLQR
jgi:hypothetical protein